MKKTILGVMTLVMALTFTACPNIDSAEYAEYYGTWKLDYGGGSWEQVTINANGIISKNQSEVIWSMENLTWTPVTNPSGAFMATNPTGYKIVGKLTAKAPWAATPYKAGDEVTPAAIGDLAVVWWYLSTDKKSIRLGDWSGDHKADSSPFVKQ
jgi:hypothetical protein